MTMAIWQKQECYLFAPSPLLPEQGTVVERAAGTVHPVPTTSSKWRSNLKNTFFHLSKQQGCLSVCLRCQINLESIIVTICWVNIIIISWYANIKHSSLVVFHTQRIKGLGYIDRRRGLGENGD